MSDARTTERSTLTLLDAMARAGLLDRRHGGDRRPNPGAEDEARRRWRFAAEPIAPTDGLSPRTRVRESIALGKLSSPRRVAWVLRALAMDLLARLEAMRLVADDRPELAMAALERWCLDPATASDSLPEIEASYGAWREAHGRLEEMHRLPSDDADRRAQRALTTAYAVASDAAASFVYATPEDLPPRLPLGYCDYVEAMTDLGFEGEEAHAIGAAILESALAEPLEGPERRRNPGRSRKASRAGRVEVTTALAESSPGEGIARLTVTAEAGGGRIGRAVAEVGSIEAQLRWRGDRGGLAQAREWRLFRPEDLVAYVRDVDVEPGHRRRGAGRQLMQALLDEIDRRGAAAWLVAAPTDEDGAPAAELGTFYESLGFEPFAGGGYAALSMVRPARTERRGNPRAPAPTRLDAKTLRAAVRRRDLDEIARIASLDVPLLERNLSSLNGWFRGRGAGMLAYQAAAAAVLHAGDETKAREHTARILAIYGGDVRRAWGKGWRSAAQHRSVRTLAEASQAMYDEDELVLYRGIYEEQGTALRRAISAMGAWCYYGIDATRHDPITVELAPVSSWSESRKRATMFASGYGVGRPLKGAVVLRMRVPLRDVAFSWRLLRSGIAGADEGAMALRDREVGVFSTGVARLTLDDIDVNNRRPADW